MNTRIITTAIALAMMSVSAFAADGIWSGATDATWAGANWTGGVPGTGETATFNAAGNGNTTISLGSGVTLLNLLFDTSAAAAYTIGSGGVGSQTNTLNHGGSITLNAAVTNNQTFNSAITLGTDKNTGTYTLQNNSAQSLTLAGNILGSSTGTTAGDKTLAFGGAGNFNVGNISKGGANYLQLNLTGGGTLYASGTLTPKGRYSVEFKAVVMSGGTLDLGTTGVLNIEANDYRAPGISGSGTVKGGTVSNAGLLYSTGVLTISSPITSLAGSITCDAAGKVVALTNPNNSFSQNIMVTSDAILSVPDIGCLGSGSTISFGSGNYGTGRIVFTGNGGTVNKSMGPGSSNCGWSIDQSGTGLLKMASNSQTGSGGAGGLTLKGSTSGSGEFAGIISVTHPVTKSGTGTWTLNGANTYTNTTTINAGKLTLNYDTGAGGTDSTKLSDTAALKLNGGTLELSGGTHPEVVLSTTLDIGTSLIKRNGGSATLTLGAITFTAGALDVGATGLVTTTSINLSSGILSLRATLAGADYAKNDGANNIVAYTGYTPFTGTLAANTIYSLTGNAAVSTQQSQTTSGLKIAPIGSGYSLAFNSGNFITVGSILFTGPYDYSITTPGGKPIEAKVLLNYGSGNLILGKWSTTFYQYGTGKTILTTPANNEANFQIYGGIVQFSDKFQIGPLTADWIVSLNNGTLLADTATADIALTKADGSSSRTYSIGEGGGTFDVIGGKSLILVGVISGTGPVTFGSASSSGSILMTTNNTYSGPTRINGGIIKINGTNSGNGDVSVNNGGTLLVNGTKSGIGAVSVNSGGTLGGTGTVSGATSVVSGGTLAPGGTDGLGTLTCGNTTLASGTTLHVHVAGDAAGQYSVLNVGSGTLALGGASLAVEDTGFSGTGPVVIARAGAITGTFGSVTGTKRTWKATTVNNTIVLNATNAGTLIRFF